MQGISVQKLALMVALGVCLGIIPLLGATSLLCMLAAFIWRLNMPAIQLVNYVTYPVQLILYIPFLRTGTHLFSKAEFNYSLAQIVDMLRTDMWKTMNEFIYVNLYGLLLGLLICPMLFVGTYLLCNHAFGRIAGKINDLPISKADQPSSEG